MPSVETSVGKIYYAQKDDVLSQKPPLIIIHGAGSNHLEWSADIRRLAGLRVIAPDLPGHGRSPLPGRDSIVAYAESIRQLMDALNIPKALIAGHSMGGAIAQTMGVHMRQYVAGLILIGTGGRLKVNPKILETVRDDPVAVAELIDGWQWKQEPDERMIRLSRQQFLSTDPQVIYGDYFACSQFNILDQLPNISAPTLVIGGDSDQMTPFRLSEELASQLPNAKLIKISDAGHKILLEYPRLAADHISRWIEAQDFKA